MAGASADSVPNTSPQTVAVRSLRGPCCSIRKDLSIPPMPLTPSLKATPVRFPFRS